MANRTGKGYFQPGNNANPSGRPKADPELVALCKSHTKEAIENLVSIMRNSIKDENRLKAIEMILDRAYGKPISIEVDPGSGEPLKPIVVQVVSDK